MARHDNTDRARAPVASAPVLPPSPSTPEVSLAEYESVLAARDRLGLRVSELEAALRFRDARLAESLAAGTRLEQQNASLRESVQHLEERRTAGLAEIDRLQALVDLAATQQTAALLEQRRALNKVHDKALREATEEVSRLEVRNAALLEELRLRGIAPPAGKGSYTALASLSFHGRHFAPGERFDAAPGEVASLPPESYTREG